MSRNVLGFGVRVGAAVLATLVATPLVAPLLPPVPLHRLVTRVFLVAAVVAFVVGRGAPRTWPQKLVALGLRGPDRARRFLWGAGVSILLVAVLLAVEWAVGGRGPPPPPKHALLVHFLSACLSGVAVGFLEEILFRGYVKDAVGNPLSALLYAGVHFLKPLHGSAPAGAGFDPWLGFKSLPLLFESFTHPRFVTLGIFSLFLFGLALNRLRERTGTLYLGIGLHAGLVFALSFYRRFLHSVTTGDPWLHGGGRLHDGVLGTVALALLLWAAYRAPLPRFLKARDPMAA